MKRRESSKPEISLSMVSRGARVDLWMTGAVVALALSGCSSAPVEVDTAVTGDVETAQGDVAFGEGCEGGEGAEGCEGGEGGGEGGEGGGEGGEGGGEGGDGGEGGEGGGEGGEGGGEGGEGGEGGGEGGEGGAGPIIFDIHSGPGSIFVPGALYSGRVVGAKTQAK